MSTDLIQLWHERARPKPTQRDLDVQVACFLEEVLETLQCMRIASPRAELLEVQLGNLCWDLKLGRASVEIVNRELLLDGLCDTIVTAQGVGHCAAMNVTEGLRRVNSSNWSKFDVATGEPIRDANGKIAKGPDYRPPNLEGLY